MFLLTAFISVLYPDTPKVCLLSYHMPFIGQGEATCSFTWMRWPSWRRLSSSSRVRERPRRGVLPLQARLLRTGRSTSSSTKINLKCPTLPSTQPFQRPDGFLAMRSMVSPFCQVKGRVWMRHTNKAPRTNFKMKSLISNYCPRIRMILHLLMQRNNTWCWNLMEDCTRSILIELRTLHRLYIFRQPRFVLSDMFLSLFLTLNFSASLSYGEGW